MEPNYVKEGHMSRYKKGAIKDTEQFVFCKLKPPVGSHRPELHGFTDGGSGAVANFVLKVKSFAAVQRSDQVPKIVKARYDNYICVTSKGGKVDYIRTDTREQRDEWCDTLQRFFDDHASNLCARKNPTRERLQTDVTSNRQPPNRGRRNGSTMTAPGTMVETFHGELARTVQNVQQQDSRSSSPSSSRDSPVPRAENMDHLCCPKHHVEAVGLEESPYMNIHPITNLQEWRRKAKSSREVLCKQKELYNAAHLVSQLQSHQQAVGEDQYAVPVELSSESPPYRWSSSSSSSEHGTSTPGSEESTSGGSLSIRSTGKSSPRSPAGSWPSTPGEPADEPPSDFPPPPRALLRSGHSQSFKQELASKIVLPGMRKTSLPVQVEARTSLPPPPPCEEEDSIYVNRELVNRDLGRARGMSSAGLRPSPTATFDSGSPRSRTIPKLPGQRPTHRGHGGGAVGGAMEGSMEGDSDMPSIPPPLPPKKLSDKAKDLKKERLRGSTDVSIPKTDLLQNEPYFKQKNNVILVTWVPPEMKNYFRVGDQLMKINGRAVSDTRQATRLIQQTDKPSVVVTVCRIPYGTVCDFRWPSGDFTDLGMTLRGPQVTSLSHSGLVMRVGRLPSLDTQSMRGGACRCNYAITEINFNQVEPNSRTDEVRDMLSKAGKDILLILHPQDFLDFQMRADQEDIYENV